MTALWTGDAMALINLPQLSLTLCPTSELVHRDGHRLAGTEAGNGTLAIVPDLFAHSLGSGKLAIH